MEVRINNAGDSSKRVVTLRSTSDGGGVLADVGAYGRPASGKRNARSRRDGGSINGNGGKGGQERQRQGQRTARGSADGVEDGRKRANGSGQGRGRRGGDVRELSKLIRKAEETKAHKDEETYDDLLSKYFGDRDESGGGSGRKEETETSTLKKGLRGTSSPTSPRGQSSLPTPPPHPSRACASKSGSDSGAHASRTISDKGGRPSSGRNGGSAGRGRPSKQELTDGKATTLKALQEAERRKKMAEDMAKQLKDDAEQMRQTAETLVLEKAKMSDEYTKVVHEREILLERLAFLEQMMHEIEMSQDDREDEEQVSDYDDGYYDWGQREEGGDRDNDDSGEGREASGATVSDPTAEGLVPKLPGEES